MTIRCIVGIDYTASRCDRSKTKSLDGLPELTDELMRPKKGLQIDYWKSRLSEKFRHRRSAGEGS